MSTECTALVRVPQPVLPATQVESKACERGLIASTGQEETILSLGIDGVVGIHRNYAKMEASKLDLFIRGRVPKAIRFHKLFHSQMCELVPALMEMKSRFENQGARNDLHEVKAIGWHDYLRSIGLSPSTLRSWKHRMEAKQGVETGDPPAAATGKKKPAGTPRKIGAGPVEESAAQAAGNNQLGSAATAGNAVNISDVDAVTNGDICTSESKVVINPLESDSAGVRLVEERFLFAVPPSSECEGDREAPGRQGSSVSELKAEPDWKQVLIGLLQVLEQFGDRLPLVVLKEKRRIESLLAGKRLGQEESASFTAPIKPYNKVMKRDAEGNDRWLVMAEGEKQAWGTFEVESDADSAIADLRSPVVSLMATDSASKMLPASETCISRGRAGLHESAV